jgi:ABC-2 type transport system ATP-binding protein
VVLSTHQIAVAEEICTRVGIVNEGTLMADRRPDDLDAGESLLDAFLSNVGVDAAEEEWAEVADD